MNQDPSRQEEDLNLPIELTRDLLEYASKKKNALEYEKIVEKFMKISPEYRFKVFYNIAVKINELQSKK